MITSLSNKQMKYVQKLQKKSRMRNEEGVFIIEGSRLFDEVPVDRIIKGFLSESYYQGLTSSEVLQFDYEVVEDKVFKGISDTISPQGILGIVKQMNDTLEIILKKEPAHIILLDDLQDPGNLGTIIRTAEGAGVTGILLGPECVDIYNPKTIRSTMGSLFRVPFCHVTDMEETIDLLQEYHITVYAADLNNANEFDKENFKKSAAFLIGNEGNGLKDHLKEKAEKRVKIPMEGVIESLNAAVAASLLMYEVYRQRR